MNKKAEGQLTFIISLITIGLFTIAILNFSVGFGNDNNSYINIAQDPQVVDMRTQTIGNVTSFKGESEQTTASILNSTISAGSTTTTSGTQYAITTTSSVGTMTNIFKIGYQKIFGTNNGFGIFMTTFLVIISGILTAYLIKLWRAGLPD